MTAWGKEEKGKRKQTVSKNQGPCMAQKIWALEVAYLAYLGMMV